MTRANQFNIFLFIIFMLSVPAISAQQIEFGANFVTGFPQQEFKHNLDATGFGLDLSATYQHMNHPIAFGLDLGFMTYGTSERREPFNPQIPEVSILVRTSNNIVFGHLLGRVQPPDGKLRPYLDVLFGFNYLYTESKIQDERNNEDIAGSTNFDDIALSGGVGIGTKIKLAETTEPDSGQLLKIYLDLRGRYLLGGEAEYLKEGSIRNENGKLAYDVTRSRTDLLTIHIGVTVQVF